MGPFSHLSVQVVNLFCQPAMQPLSCGWLAKQIRRSICHTVFLCQKSLSERTRFLMTALIKAAIVRSNLEKTSQCQ
ncbi:hypothetical protein EDC54_101722 [Samsonia erythrinae]|uniref:Uncharacterized protein n=1 Tax=Samsonia erythrinae TaxID=160434 RepID=A0A4R3VQ25_9GAMM|nr:hypothetical protein EDC54_101722 [Samsonia erythrinae]